MDQAVFHLDDVPVRLGNEAGAGANSGNRHTADWMGVGLGKLVHIPLRVIHAREQG